MYGETLKKYRIKRNMTRKEASAKLNISYAVYRNWESGESSIPIDYIVPICQVLNISCDKFLTEHLHTMEWYKEKFNEAEGLIHYVERDKRNKEMVLWLFNEFDGNIDGLVLMSTAYACLSPAIRKRLSAFIWNDFKDKYRNSKVDMPPIAEVVNSQADKYIMWWKELSKKEEDYL